MESARCLKDHRMTAETGFVAKTITFSGQAYRYAVYVPPDYTRNTVWSAILYLHGKGERGVDGLRHTAVGLGKHIGEHPERFGCIVVMPQCRPDSAWEGATLDLALACLEAALDEYAIDRNRVVLTGLSLGGFGAWSLGAQYPDRFCALAPVCGGGDPGDAGKLAGLPIWSFHGEADPVVPVQRSREMVEAVRAAGGEVKYTEYADVAHNSWDLAYGDPEVIGWMLAQHQ